VPAISREPAPREPAAAPAATDRATVHVARQPILEANGQVFGYELLYRARQTDTACTAEGDLASARVLTDAVLEVGLDTLTGGRPAFLNLTKPLITSQVAVLLPHAAAVYELREDVEVDDAVVEACRDLHARGYRLALDDFVPGSAAEQLMPYVSFVKIDVQLTEMPLLLELPRRYKPHRVTMVAEKVETREMFDATRQAGYTLFQGYYFCRPIIRTGTTLPAKHVTYMRLLSEINRPDLTVRELEELIKQDASLSLKVLRCVNSAALPLRREVRSLHDALVLLGIGPIRQWASVWCLAGLNTGGSPELATLALLRARSCELAAGDLRAVDTAELFLVGLCSVLDSMLGRPMSEALEHLPLSPAAKQTLLGEPSPMRAILDAIVAQEAGAWSAADTSAAVAGVTPDSLSKAYIGALRWAGALTRTEGH
jgi:EAL and modified HD-GYP domain-containing signal transduction protein